MFVFSDSFRKAVEKGLHRRRIGIGHRQREGIVGARLNGGEDIGEGRLLDTSLRLFSRLNRRRRLGLSDR